MPPLRSGWVSQLNLHCFVFSAVPGHDDSSRKFLPVYSSIRVCLGKTLLTNLLSFTAGFVHYLSQRNNASCYKCQYRWLMDLHLNAVLTSATELSLISLSTTPRINAKYLQANFTGSVFPGVEVRSLSFFFVTLWYLLQWRTREVTGV